MTKQETIERIKLVHCWTDINHNPTVNSYECSLYMNNDGLCEDCEYHIAIECIEKQIPRNVNSTLIQGGYVEDDGTKYDIVRNTCPICGHNVERFQIFDFGTVGHKFCGGCGQAIDWSDNE